MQTPSLRLALVATASILCFSAAQAASVAPVAAEHGMVVTAQQLATRVGVEVLTKDGNAVAVTSALNDWFGAKVAAAGTGVLLNNALGY